MSRKPENQFIDSVHRHLPPPSELHREGMANPYRSGTADMWYSGQLDLWIEYKFLVVPKRDSTIIDLVAKGDIISKLQSEWLQRRYNEGRRVWVIVGCKEGGVVFTDRSWENALTAGVFKTMLVDRKTVAQRILQAVRPNEPATHLHDRARHERAIPNRINHATADLHRSSRKTATEPLGVISKRG
jgi:hypothetical protein